MIEKISSYIPSITDFSDLEPARPVKKTIPHPGYYKDTIGSAEEHYLDKALINACASQRKNHEDSAILSTQSLKESMSANNTLRKEIYDEQDELIKKHKKSEGLKIADGVVTAGVVVTGVITVGLAVFLGFTAPLALVIAGGLFGIASGATKIVNGVNRHESDLLTSQIFELGEKRKMNHTKSLDHMESQNSSKDRSSETFKILVEIEKRKQETISAIVGRS